ncbi:MAG: hypothetical protein ABFD46_07380 [Armatimonadota bacterium]
MKKTVLITIAFALLAAASYAQQPEIPAPVGATLVTEINLSDTDILGMIKQALPAFAQAAAGTPGEVGDLIKQLDIDSFSAAIEGVRQVRVLQFDIPKTANITKMLDFYQAKFTADDGWSRIIYDISMAPAKAGAVYTHGGQDFLAVGVDTNKSRLYVARTVGFVDVPKLAAWFGNAIKVYSQIAETQQTVKPKPEQKQPSSTVSPAKKTAPAPKAPVKK